LFATAGGVTLVVLYKVLELGGPSDIGGGVILLAGLGGIMAGIALLVTIAFDRHEGRSRADRR